MPKEQKTKPQKVIHPYSRKALKVERQINHDKRAVKSRSDRSSKLDVLADKLKWFHDRLDDRVSYTKADLVDLVQQYLGRFDEELEQIAIVQGVGARKPNKQHAPRQAAIKITMEMEKNEFESVGIQVPDLINGEHVKAFRDWNGEMKYMQNFKMRKISARDVEKLEAKLSHCCHGQEEPQSTSGVSSSVVT
ncbi:hypothetical protein BaRGS_00006305 [Batillaria attramentaria]|uniref:Translation machinery-associated protein 16 n=1 Tax=Batillaria attramentaria TaxID=370345 RepID=A0ABD0LSD3_9CAEN